jgi:translation initiation factor IF-2
LSKLRVNEMAGEFGISADEVIALLRQMDIPVRSHISPLTDDQVARIRARWEREKRARAEKPAAAVAAKGGRRRSAAAPVVAAPAPVAVAETSTAVDADGSPVRRRRKAKDVESAAAAAAEVAAEAERKALEDAAAREAERAEAERVALADAERRASELEQRRRVDEEREAQRRAEREAGATSSEGDAGSQAPDGGAATRAASAPSAPGSSAPSAPRPRPLVPGAPRQKPSAANTRYMPPRPVASAQPGGYPPAREARTGGGPGAGGGGGGSAAPSAPPMGDRDRGRGRKKGKRGQVDQEAVASNISRTMSAMRGPAARRGGPRRDETGREEIEAERAAAVEREKTTVRVNEFITVSELAQTLKITPTEIVAFAFKNLGLMVTINQRLDFDQIELIAGEFGFQAVREDEYQRDVQEEAVDAVETLKWRPPVVTIMGHVDHGKTSLLDYIRKANVVAGEAGGITQHIGAYHVTVPGGKDITFLDTPGHEAFTAMRARGAQVTDIVILVVAADDAVMPQTIEAISHAKNAGVPLIVAINKIDLPQANPKKVAQDLLQHGVVLEAFGGTTLSSEISAKKGTNVQSLLDQVLLQAEILDLKANPDRRAIGTVVEAQLDPGKGPVATVLVQNGTLRIGDDFICGMYSGRVRALLDERGKPVKSAGPAIPVQVLGIEGVPMAGDQLIVVEEATDARDVAQRRQRLDREAKSRRMTRGAVVTLEDFIAQAGTGEKRSLRILIKADQGGPAEALADALQQLSNAEVQVEVIHRGVGAITESDILLARASGAIIIGFHVRPDNNARSAAEREGVDIKLYRIIYEAVADVRSALEGLLRPEEKEVILGEAQVRETFKVPKIGVIAGCSVRSGVINRQGRVRVIRDGVEVYDGTIASLRRFKDDVKEVREGFECGIGIENFNDIKVGDVLECYRKEQVARTLTSAAGASA